MQTSPSDSGRTLRGLLWCALALVVATIPPTFADEIGARPDTVGEKVEILQLTPEQRQRARTLYNRIMCDCPKENYSRTLQGCPDGCADPQKFIINRMVRDDHSDEEVFQVMLQRTGYDTRVIADTQGAAGQLVRTLPVVFLALGILVVVVILANWKRGGSSAKVSRQRQQQDVSDPELERVERELAELE